MAKLLARVAQQGPVLAATPGVDLGRGTDRLVPADALARAEKKNGSAGVVTAGVVHHVA